METQLRAILSFLRSRGVEPVLGKGWAVARHYPAAGLRPFGDLDLLIRPEEMGAAVEALNDPDHPMAPVEIHGSFHQLLDRSLADLLHRSRFVPLGDTEVRILAPEDHLRLLALHGFGHGHWRPLWLCDLAVFLEEIGKEEDPFDWELCMSGDRWRSEGVRCGLGLARALLGVELEKAGVPAAWRDPSLPEWLIPSVLRSWGARKHWLHMDDARELVGSPRKLLAVAGLKWSNPLEVTYRRGAPWNENPRLPYQVFDYLARGLGFIGGLPGATLRRRRRPPSP